MSTPIATAGWPLDRLVSALARAAWAELDTRTAQGMRNVLRGLSDLLPHKSAQGTTTAPQIADVTGLSERWVRTCLTRLEASGVITWTRGGIRDGQPIPSIIRVSKRALADLINRARKTLPARHRERARVTAERIRTTLRTRSAWPKPSKPLATTAELSASPLPLRGEGTGPTGPLFSPPTSIFNRPRLVGGSRAAALRQALAGQP